MVFIVFLNKVLLKAKVLNLKKHKLLSGSEHVGYLNRLKLFK